MSDIHSDFGSADLSDLPSIATMEDDERKALWILLVGRERLSYAALSPHDVSVVLRDVYGYDIPRQRLQAIFNRANGKVARRRTRHGVRYQLMAAGKEEVLETGPSIVFIQPEASLSAIRTVESVLGSLRGTVRVCDPYVDGATLDMLSVVAGASSIRLLTMNINRPAPFARDLAAFRRENTVGIEVRSATAGVLHDRYVVDDDGMYLVGTSLNHIGKKQTFVVRAGDDVRAMAISAFDTVWGSSIVV